MTDIPPDWEQYNQQANESMTATIQPIKPALKSVPTGFGVVTIDEASEVPPQRWLIKGVIPSSGVGMIFGPPSCGKSFLGFDLMGAVGSEDRQWFGIKTQHRPVLYIGLEGQTGIGNRACAYLSVYGGCARMRLALRANWSLLNKEDLDAMIEWALANGFYACVLMIDTINRAAPIDENKSEEMGRVIWAMGYIHERLAGVVIGIHHSGKDTTKGLRGHSSLHAALDFAIGVENNDGDRVWRMSKSKDGVDGEEHGFRLKIIEVGEDEDGDKITSCVVEPTGEGAPRVVQRFHPRGSTQTMVWKVVGPLLKNGKVGVDGAPLGYPAITVFDAVEAVIPRLLSVEPKNRRTVVRRALMAMIAGGLFGVNKDEWIWLTRER